MEKRVLSDFSLGEWQLERVDVKVPGGAVKAMRDAYVDASGVPRGRGRVRQKIVGALGGTLATFVWAGAMLPGRRGLVVSQRAKAFDPDASVMYAGIGDIVPGGNVDNFTVVGNTLVLGTRGSVGATLPQFYGGANVNASPAALGACTRTAGSQTVTRAAGGFTANIVPGYVISGWRTATGGSLTSPGFAVVKSVESDTSLTVDRPSPFTEAGTFTMNAWFCRQPTPFGSWTTVAPLGLVGSIAGRLLLMNKNVLRFSQGPDPATGTPRTDVMNQADLHEFPVDADAIAIYTLRDRVFVFTEAGNFAVSGMSYEIVDGSGNPQHPIEQITGKSVALAQKGIVSWQNALIVPCRDGIYVMDGYGAPVLLSRNVPWAELVRDGVQIGFATVYKERYILPYTYNGETHQLVFRTDGRDTSLGTVFSASTFTMPGNPMALATDKNDSLLAVGTAADGVLEAGDVFSETGDGLDYDGGPAAGSFLMTTGPIALGDKGTVRRVRVRYTWKVGTGTPTAILAVRVTADDGARFQEQQIEIDQAAPTRWVAVDFTTPVESDKVVVDVYLITSKPSGFALQAIEVQYRAFGGV